MLIWGKVLAAHPGASLLHVPYFRAHNLHHDLKKFNINVGVQVFQNSDLRCGFTAARALVPHHSKFHYLQGNPTLSPPLHVDRNLSLWFAYHVIKTSPVPTGAIWRRVKSSLRFLVPSLLPMQGLLCLHSYPLLCECKVRSDRIHITSHD